MAIHYGTLTVLSFLYLLTCASAIGVNWGIQSSHPLPPSTVVQMLKDNGIQKVKLFEADEGIMEALKKSGIQVMVGIPNDLLDGLAGSEKTAENWVSKNVSKYVNDGVDVRYVAVGNEPFLQTYNGSFLNITYPAIQNVQAALIKAGIGNQVKVTVPLNADVYTSPTGKPSDGDFRSDIHGLMVQIVSFLNDNNAPITVNIYPFISLYEDPNFPLDYAFFQGSAAPVVDGSISYTNVLDANHDTLLSALRKNGFNNLSIIVGEIGWPTDGDMNANMQNARQFNQGLVNHVSSSQGTPLRPGPMDVYLFSLIDEDLKSIQPGNFERHWGILYYDGTPKYQLSLSGTNTSATLVGAKGVKYLDRKWCVLKPSIGLDNQNIAAAVSYACANADCSSLGYKTSCGNLDARGNISYALNSYYQMNDQDERACDFNKLATVTTENPSTTSCRFNIMIEASLATSLRLIRCSWGWVAFVPLLVIFL
ncbi:glucan endo-1,3-beta-glucosidase 6-like protein [Carex littledalei]|uniref:glucan endo-1,3-beta-D-glucosidase n=1 Tax=Carex littledalei TaxID=544730 RepID=A0A833QUP4_9POAL|nr:glucan endo-1,3-beta-glucosidase 6-like protein [Carex littledalei]